MKQMNYHQPERIKIGLLTYHHTTNFGSLLQTYALYKFVVNMGYSCEIIDYRCEEIEQREFVKKIYQCHGLKEVKNFLQYNKYKKLKAKEFYSFLQSNFAMSQKVYNLKNIAETNTEYDIFLIGSDLVWDFSINGHDTTYMLDFVDNKKKKIAYAASVGQIWDIEDQKKVKVLLDRFNFIGVREKEIQIQLNKLLNVNVDFVCDPTMLISQEEWKQMAADKIIEEKYVLCYMSDDNQTIYTDAIRYGKEHGLPVYLISYDWVPNSMKPIRPYSTKEFLSLFMYANTVFTASYHGMLFSLYFKKDFYYYNRGWKARMQSISDYFDLNGRQHYSNNNEPLDYDRIYEKINKFRNESIFNLKNYLTN